jgi:eukaryotic-like serine/threonine-protein kinase
VRCSNCDSVVSSDDNATVVYSDENATVTHLGWSQAASKPAAAATQSLTPGMLLAGRYEIIKLLGQGGMGAVYKARDVELDRPVALKVIRADLAGDSKTLARFKQELILARQVTHKNVIRIFDLGAHEGVRFITMEFVEGHDLSALLERQKFTPDQAARIVRQVCLALEAAHAEKVIHRDLKPQNVMVDEAGTVRVMDFGLARSVELSGLTQTGAILGTPAYMSPEQAKGTPVDERSDLFSLGIILYELLTGEVPFKADTTWGTLVKRTQTPAEPAISINPDVPQALSDIAARCLAIDPAERYQNASQVAADLTAWIGDAPSASRVIAPPPKRIVTPRMAMMSESSAWKWIAISVTATFLVLGGAYLLFRQRAPAAPPPPMTVLVADFNNHTGDPVFTGTLESTLKLVLEGASFVSAYDRARVRDLGLKALTGPLDDARAQEIAASQGLNVVVSGALDRRGSDYQLSARAVQTVTGKVLTTAEATAPNKDQILFAVTKLGTAIRKALGDSTSESDQRLSMETLSAVSLEAVHEYAAGLDALSAGKFEESQQHLSRAVDLDPNFGMAYTVMASAARNRGRFQDAENYIREALKHIDHMTERERYRTRAYLYSLTGDQQKCVDEYSALIAKYPADTGGYTNLSICLLHLRNVPKSEEAAQKAVAILPKRAIYHANLALAFSYGGDAPGAAKEAAEALKLGYSNAYLLEAFSSLLQDQPDQAADAYHKFEKINPSDGATALADLAVYEGRYSDAVNILEKGAAEDLNEKKPDADAAATKYWALANVQRLRGQKAPALAAAKRALELNQAFQTRLVTAQVYVALGELDKARELAKGLSAELQIEPQAYGKLIEGEAVLKDGDGRGAVKLFTEANNILDTWMGRFDLGRAYLEIGAFAEADSEFDRCVKRRGEALGLFIDLPTYGYFPPVYYYQGRAREGMKSSGFAESYKKYLSIRGKAGEDPLLAEVRRHNGQ